jgi:hypothetical protein
MVMAGTRTSAAPRAQQGLALAGQPRKASSLAVNQAGSSSHG